MSAEQVRNLKIKTGAVRRTAKEYLYYFTEKTKEEAFLEKMRIISADPYDIKQQENVVQESQMMIPETKKQLEGLLADLKQYYAEVGDVIDKEVEENKAAAEVIASAENSLKE
jgi:tubulin-specific chaperone A